MTNYIQKLLDLFSKSTPKKETTEKIQQWLIAPEHAEEKELAMQKLWEQTASSRRNDGKKTYGDLRLKLGLSSPHISIKRSSLRRYAAAAIVLLLLSTYLSHHFTKQDSPDFVLAEHFTPIAEIQQVILPDGSLVETNSTSLLVYPENFNGENRTIYLIGEANFKVQPDPNKPFIVKSGDFAVTALGTEFNVSAYAENDYISACLLQGSIKVAFPENQEGHILQVGEQLTYSRNDKNYRLDQANIKEVTAWQRGELLFREATLKEIINSLERRYPISFQYSMQLIDEDKYNFRFKNDASIDEVMNIIKEVVGSFEYSIQNDMCYLKKSSKKK